MRDSTDKEAYAAHIKVGDAVQTPDGELWVVTGRNEGAYALASAYRGTTGHICPDIVEPTRTVLSAEYLTKIADARQVRR